MTLVRAAHGAAVEQAADADDSHAEPPEEQDVPPEAPTLEQAIRARHHAGTCQRAIARELDLDRRKVKQVIGRAA